MEWVTIDVPEYCLLKTLNCHPKKFIFLFSAGDGIQDLMHALQVLEHFILVHVRST